MLVSHLQSYLNVLPCMITGISNLSNISDWSCVMKRWTEIIAAWCFIPFKQQKPFYTVTETWLISHDALDLLSHYPSVPTQPLSYIVLTSWLIHVSFYSHTSVFTVTSLLYSVTWLLYSVTSLLYSVTWLLYSVTRLLYSVTWLLYSVTSLMYSVTWLIYKNFFVFTLLNCHMGSSLPHDFYTACHLTFF